MIYGGSVIDTLDLEQMEDMVFLKGTQTKSSEEELRIISAWIFK